MAEFIEVSAAGELKSRTMKAVVVAGREILLARVGDKFYAADRLCPHMKGDLSQGQLAGTVVTCPRHGSQFDLTTGRVVRWLGGGMLSKVGTAFRMSRDLVVYNVKVQDGKVMVEF
jgi:3-phenylpropionate/trans-cinnamate dioxygenase ferredoxin component